VHALPRSAELARPHHRFPGAPSFQYRRTGRPRLRRRSRSPRFPTSREWGADQYQDQRMRAPGARRLAAGVGVRPRVAFPHRIRRAGTARPVTQYQRKLAYTHCICSHGVPDFSRPRQQRPGRAAPHRLGLRTPDAGRFCQGSARRDAEGALDRFCPSRTMVVRDRRQARRSGSPSGSAGVAVNDMPPATAAPAATTANPRLTWGGADIDK